EDERAVEAGAVRVPEPRRMAMHVPVERLLSSIDHAHGTAGREREQTEMDLQRDILPRAERPTDTGEHEVDLRLGQAEAGGDLSEILVQPLRRDVQRHAAVRIRDRESGLGTEWRLVLHPDLVLALDDDLGGRVRVAVHDAPV